MHACCSSDFREGLWEILSNSLKSLLQPEIIHCNKDKCQTGRLWNLDFAHLSVHLLLTTAYF